MGPAGEPYPLHTASTADSARVRRLLCKNVLLGGRLDTSPSLSSVLPPLSSRPGLMESNVPLTFSGEEGEDVALFLQRVQQEAFTQGKQRDDSWIADYAGTLMGGSALRWYYKLDDEVQGSWKKLRLAMNEHFTFNAGDQQRGERLRSPSTETFETAPPNYSATHSRRNTNASVFSSYTARSRTPMGARPMPQTSHSTYSTLSTNTNSTYASPAPTQTTFGSGYPGSSTHGHAQTYSQSLSVRPLPPLPPSNPRTPNVSVSSRPSTSYTEFGTAHEYHQPSPQIPPSSFRTGSLSNYQRGSDYAESLSSVIGQMPLPPDQHYQYRRTAPSDGTSTPIRPPSEYGGTQHLPLRDVSIAPPLSMPCVVQLFLRSSCGNDTNLGFCLSLRVRRGHIKLVEVDLGRPTSAGYLNGKDGRYGVQRSKHKAMIVEIPAFWEESDQKPWEMRISVSTRSHLVFDCLLPLILQPLT